MPSPSDAAPAQAAPAPVWVAGQRQLFQRVLRALRHGGLGYAVAGAVAFQHYTGIWRFTKDLDIFLPAELVPAALASCRGAGLATEVTDPVWLAKAWAGDYYVDLISGMSNGAYWVRPDWIERAHQGPVLGRTHPILAPEEMIISKIFVTRRERFDGSDICHLLYCRGRLLDWPHLLREAGAHWEMLLWHLTLFRYVYPAAARTVIPAGVWRELGRRVRRQGQPPPTTFRGSLIDPFMFAVDVEAWGLENAEAGSRRSRLRSEA